MKPVYIILLLSLVLAGCSKSDLAPVAAAKSNTLTTQINPYWYNGTTGNALIQVTCNDCTAIATIGDTTTPFLFNAQGVGQLKYTPSPGLAVYIAVCPGGVKAIKAEIFNATNTSLYSYSGTGGNWNNTYILK